MLRLGSTPLTLRTSPPPSLPTSPPPDAALAPGRLLQARTASSPLDPGFFFLPDHEDPTAELQLLGSPTSAGLHRPAGGTAAPLNAAPLNAAPLTAAPSGELMRGMSRPGLMPAGSAELVVPPATSAAAAVAAGLAGAAGWGGVHPWEGPPLFQQQALPSPFVRPGPSTPATGPLHPLPPGSLGAAPLPPPSISPLTPAAAAAASGQHGTAPPAAMPAAAPAGPYSSVFGLQQGPGFGVGGTAPMDLARALQLFVPLPEGAVMEPAEAVKLELMGLTAAGSGAVAPAAAATAAAHTAPSLGSSNSTQLGVAPLVLQANAPQGLAQLHPSLGAGQMGRQGVHGEQVPAAAAAAAAVAADGADDDQEEEEEHEKPLLSEEAKLQLPHITLLTPQHMRKGKGGRQPAPDPRLDPNMDPKRARRIMANRLSAAKSKLKKNKKKQTGRGSQSALAAAAAAEAEADQAPGPSEGRQQQQPAQAVQHQAMPASPFGGQQPAGAQHVGREEQEDGALLPVTIPHLG